MQKQNKIKFLKEAINVIYNILVEKYSKNIVVSAIVLCIALLISVLPLPDVLNIPIKLIFWIVAYFFIDIKIQEEIDKEKEKQKNVPEEIINTIAKEEQEEVINEKEISLTRLVLNLIKELAKKQPQIANITLKKEDINKKEIGVIQQIPKLTEGEQKKQKDLFDPNKPSYKV